MCTFIILYFAYCFSVLRPIQDIEQHKFFCFMSCMVFHFFAMYFTTFPRLSMLWYAQDDLSRPCGDTDYVWNMLLELSKGVKVLLFYSLYYLHGLFLCMYFVTFVFPWKCVYRRFDITYMQGLTNPLICLLMIGVNQGWHSKNHGIYWIKCFTTPPTPLFFPRQM
jgi:hypothetical protein